MSVGTLKIVKDLGRKEILLSIARDHVTGRVYCGASDGRIYGVDPNADKPEFAAWEGHSSYVTGVAVAGRSLVSGSYDGRLIWWNLESGTAVRTVEAHARWIRRIAASPDGTRIASVADDMACKIWDAGEGRLVHELRGHAPRTPHHFPSMLYACGFSPDGAQLATVDRVGHVVIWDARTGKQETALEVPQMYTWDPKQRIHSIGGPRCVAFSPDGVLLAIGGMDQVGNIDHLEGKSRVEVFDWRKGERVHEFSGDSIKGLVERMVFSADGQWLLAAGGDNGGFLQCCDLAAKSVAKQEKAPTHVHDMVASESLDRVFAAAHQRLLVWEVTA